MQKKEGEKTNRKGEGEKDVKRKGEIKHVASGNAARRKRYWDRGEIGSDAREHKEFRQTKMRGRKMKGIKEPGFFGARARARDNPPCFCVITLTIPTRSRHPHDGYWNSPLPVVWQRFRRVSRGIRKETRYFRRVSLSLFLSLFLSLKKTKLLEAIF